MLTATWHIACRLLNAYNFYQIFTVPVKVLSILHLVNLKVIFNFSYSCHTFRLCVTGQIMMSVWKSLWALWLTSWIRTACLQCTHTTACCIHSLMASARPLLNATETFVWTRYTQWSKQVNFNIFFWGGSGRWLVMAVTLQGYGEGKGWEKYWGYLILYRKRGESWWWMGCLQGWGYVIRLHMILDESVVV